jgi:hypothetical protein
MMPALIPAAAPRNVASLLQAVAANPDRSRTERDGFLLTTPACGIGRLGRPFSDNNAEIMLRRWRSERGEVYLSSTSAEAPASPSRCTAGGRGIKRLSDRLTQPNLIKCWRSIRADIGLSCGKAKNGKKVNFLWDCCQIALLRPIPLRYIC